MNNSETAVDSLQVGRKMHQLMERLYPICRSITGDGNRQTLEIIKEHIPLQVREIPTGTHVYDWAVPREWNIRDAYIKNSKGETILDFKQSNLHVVSYSIPVRKKMSLEELKPHLHTLPNQPDCIPYLTSYYKETWGFCMPHRQYEQLQEDQYEVVIDSTLREGHLTFGEFDIEGASSDEILISCYICHPSLCNDNLSGVVLATFLANHCSGLQLRYSYRFLFIPETIGAITWLSLNEHSVRNIWAGLVATCVGDPGMLTYKKSRQGNARIDLAVEKMLADSGAQYQIIDFFPSGSDERQFCSPAFNLPVGSLMRTPYGHFPEYHTSADNPDFVKPEFLGDSLAKYLTVLYVLENDHKYLNQNPKCEPQLGKRNLYRMLGGQKEKAGATRELALLWTLNLSDGDHSLLDIAIRSKMDFGLIKEAADALVENELLKII